MFGAAPETHVVVTKIEFPANFGACIYPKRVSGRPTHGGMWYISRVFGCTQAARRVVVPTGEGWHDSVRFGAHTRGVLFRRIHGGVEFFSYTFRCPRGERYVARPTRGGGKFSVYISVSPGRMSCRQIHGVW